MVGSADGRISPETCNAAAELGCAKTVSAEMGSSASGRMLDRATAGMGWAVGAGRALAGTGMALSSSAAAELGCTLMASAATGSSGVRMLLSKSEAGVGCTVCAGTELLGTGTALSSQKASLGGTECACRGQVHILVSTKQEQPFCTHGWLWRCAACLWRP